MARIDVVMPQMGESIAEGTLSRWLKQVGDAVKRDGPMLEIWTDKVDAEIPAPVAGVLAEVLVREGETVAVQTVVARLETQGGAAGPPSPPPAPPRVPGRPPPAPPSGKARPTPPQASLACAAPCPRSGRSGRGAEDAPGPGARIGRRTS